jgi:hypothetical protein
MAAFRDNFNDRLKLAAEARKATIKKFREVPQTDDPAVLARQAARKAIVEARELRIAQRKAAQEAELARQAAEDAARIAEEAAEEARRQAEAAARNEAAKAERKALRDARYAARKGRSQGSKS